MYIFLFIRLSCCNGFQKIFSCAEILNERMIWYGCRCCVNTANCHKSDIIIRKSQPPGIRMCALWLEQQFKDVLQVSTVYVVFMLCTELSWWIGQLGHTILQYLKWSYSPRYYDCTLWEPDVSNLWVQYQKKINLVHLVSDLICHRLLWR